MYITTYLLAAKVSIVVRDAASTRARILQAAVDEFAAHGLAGGRVERIAQAAGANPRSLYVYFGNKRGLFHAAVDTALRGLGEEVPLTPDDLPGFAGRMFDWLQRHPEAVRLNRWRLLEAPQAGPDDSELYAGIVTAMVADSADPPGAVPPADLVILVPNMAAAWVSTSADLLAAGGRDPTNPQRIAAHRTSLVDAVRLLVAERKQQGRVESG